MKNSSESKKEYDKLPCSVAKYVVGGKEYSVIRHFAAQGNLKQILAETALTRAENLSGIDS